VNPPMELQIKDPKSIFYEPTTQDERDDFMEKAMDELIL
jgi:hypothetical protein